MAHKLAELRAKQKSLKEEHEGIIALAKKDAGGELTDAQDQRLAAIEGDIKKLDGEIDAEIAAMEATAPKADTDPKAAEAAADVERKRAADILACCKTLGKLDRAADFIKDGKTLAEVFGVLQNERATESDKNPTHSGHLGRQTGADHKAGWDKAVDRINKRNGFK